MTIYNFDDHNLDFDFYRTEPPVFRIVASIRTGATGAFAEATFRSGHNSDHLYSVTTWGETEDLAVDALICHLRSHYDKDDDPLFGTLIYDDPRAGLRRCIVDGDDSEVYFYHGCYTDANREECAKLEYQDGRTREAYWCDIRFVDVAEVAQCQ